MMNTNRQQQSVAIGAGLVVLGVVWWLNLWWLILPAILVTFGVVGYMQRRTMGRPVEAVQAALWGVGLGLLFLTGFLWPGILLLAGASILLRGRELEVDNRMQQTLTRVRTRRSPSYPITTQHVPISTQPPVSSPTVEDVSNTGETKRL